VDIHFVLLATAALPCTCTFQHHTFVHLLSQAGNTALHLAAAGGRMLVVRELLCAGADPTTMNEVWSLQYCSAAVAAGETAVCILLRVQLKAREVH
jgi:ankyrin repeat protein